MEESMPIVFVAKGTGLQSTPQKPAKLVMTSLRLRR
jgi:hypothetical protein